MNYYEKFSWKIVEYDGMSIEKCDRLLGIFRIRWNLCYYSISVFEVEEKKKKKAQFNYFKFVHW